MRAVWGALLSLLGLRKAVERAETDATALAEFKIGVAGAVLRGEVLAATKAHIQELRDSGQNDLADEIEKQVKCFLGGPSLPSLSAPPPEPREALPEPPAILTLPVAGDAPKRKRGRPRKHRPDEPSGGADAPSI